MDDIIKDWFSNHPVTYLNVLVVTIFLYQISDQNTTQNIKDQYHELLLKLLIDNKISRVDHQELQIRYQQFEGNGIMKDFIEIVSAIGDNPNLIYPDRWIPDNTIGRAKNSCFPCRSKSKP